MVETTILTHQENDVLNLVYVARGVPSARLRDDRTAEREKNQKDRNQHPRSGKRTSARVSILILSTANNLSTHAHS